MDTLLPKTTVGFVSATNSPRLKEQWNKTQIGTLLTQPVMKPFEEDLRAQLQAQWADLADRLGIHLDDLRGVATGEASLALIEPHRAPRPPACSWTSRAISTRRRPSWPKPGRSEGRGARETIQIVHGVPVYVLRRSAAAGASRPRRGGGGAAAAAATAHTIYFLTDNLFGACDDLAVVKDMLARLVNGSQAGSLSQVAGYQTVMKRCAADAPGHVPSIRWYIYPLGYAEATRAATPPDKRRKGKTIIEIMRNQGYAAFQRRRRFCRRFRRRLPDRPPHRRVCPAAV